MTLSQSLILGGTLLTALGLAAIVWCMVTVWRARRAGLEGDALRARLQNVIPVNMAALAGSFLGLGLVIAGILLRG